MRICSGVSSWSSSSYSTPLNDKERAALAKLFEKKEAPAEAPAPARAPAEPPSKTLAMKPNAALITKKKPGGTSSPPRSKANATSGKARKKAAEPASPAPAKVEEAPTEPAEAPAPVPDEPAIDPNASAKQLISQGRKLLLSGNPTTAEKVYRMALKKSPGSARARYGLAKALYQKSRTSEAIAELRRILAANRNHGSALLMMGSLLQEQGQAGQARTYYQRYLDTQPNGRRADEVRSILGRL